jgi:3-oxoacyl-[acyl-carrier-protein] synthase II
MNTPQITGMGLVCCLGGDVNEVYQRMCAGEHGFRSISRFDSAPYAQKNAGQLPSELEEKLREEFPDDDLAAAMVYAAGRQALSQAGRSTAPAQPEARRGLVLATNFGPMESLEWAWRERLDTQSMDEASFALFDGIIQDAAELLGCGGPQLQISMSCASGAAAIAAAQDMLAADRADQVLVLAYDSLSEFCWCGLSNLRTITTDLMRPFDQRRSGTIFSEGAAAVLLDKTATRASLASLVGCATNNNAFHMTAPSKDAEGSRQVMAAALQAAELLPEAIEHICAHATSTSANDSTESAALRNLFGARFAQLSTAAHKSQLGHLMGAAGLAEAIITVMAMRHGIIPPTINHEQPDPACQPINCLPGKAVAKQFQTAITNSAGIGGNNAALVLSTAPAAASRKVQPLAQQRQVFVRQIGWVLPGHIGQGAEILQHPEWLQWQAERNQLLADFSAKAYISSVKGYLDPAGAFLLAAMSLAGAAEPGETPAERRGICSISRYGALSSGFAFFKQLVEKGPRLASPLIFPHGYVNTAGNLAAIEFNCAGPHMVFYGKQEPQEALAAAIARLQDGSADDMFCAFYEASIPAALPDGRCCLNGSVVLRLAAQPAPDGQEDLIAFTPEELFQQSADCEQGMIAALAQLIPR